MKNYVRRLLLACTLFISVMNLNAQLSQHGLLLNGGAGRVKHEYVSNNIVSQDESHLWKNFEYKLGFSVGYRLRFKTPAPKSFHYDMDVNAGVKYLRHTYFSFRQAEDGSFEHDGMKYSATKPYYLTSIGGTVNYSIIKNFSAGIGIEPTFYLKKGSENNYYNNKYDIPLIAKVSYNFRVVEVGITGKYGLINVLESVGSSGKVRDIQLSLFIPFSTK